MSVSLCGGDATGGRKRLTATEGDGQVQSSHHHQPEGGDAKVTPELNPFPDRCIADPPFIFPSVPLSGRIEVNNKDTGY